MLNFFPPALVIYTDNTYKGFDGCSNGPVIRIKPKHKSDVGLLAHEKIHVLQWWFWVVLGLCIGYLFGQAVYGAIIGSLVHHVLLLTPMYRLFCEVMAFGVQLRYSKDKDASASKFAYFIYEHYCDYVKPKALVEIWRKNGCMRQ